MLKIDLAYGRQLPAQDDINGDESGNGYALRMATANSLSYGSVMNLVASPGHYYLPFHAAGHISYLFGGSVGRVRQAIPERLRAAGQIQVRFLGHIFTRPYLVRTTRPQVCPRCLEDLGYAKSLWELSLATACVFHQRRLVDVCLDCGRSLRWRRLSITQCLCGSDFRDIKSEAVDGPELDFNQLLSDKLHRVQSAVSGRSVRLLQPLGLNSLMRLMWAAGIAHVMPAGKAVPGSATRIPDTARAGAMVGAGLARLAAHANAFSLVADDTLWTGSGVVADLTVQEKLILEQILPFFVLSDGAGNRGEQQLSFYFESE